MLQIICQTKEFHSENGVEKEKNYLNSLPLNHDLTTLYKKPLENIAVKEENAGNQHFLLSHNVFFPI